MFGLFSRKLEVGDTWEVAYRWSGQGIASESRRDGGTKYIRIDEIDADGNITSRGSTYSPKAFRRLIKVRTVHQSDPGAFFQQRLTAYPRHIGKTQQPPKGIGDPEHEKVRDILKAGGIGALAAYYRSLD